MQPEYYIHNYVCYQPNAYVIFALKDTGTSTYGFSNQASRFVNWKDDQDPQPIIIFLHYV